MSNSQKILPLLSLINGSSIFMFLYCVLFLNELAFFGVFLILFFGVGLLIFIPHFMLIQIFWNGFIRQSKLLKIYVLIGFFSCLVPCAYVSNEYKVAIDSLKELEKSGCQKLEKTMMTEYVMGAGFIYHTSFCLFDGWRPPIHEPMLIIGRFFYNGSYPTSSCGNQIELFKKFYPNSPIKYNCSCAEQENERYHNDPTWQGDYSRSYFYFGGKKPEE